MNLTFPSPEEKEDFRGDGVDHFGGDGKNDVGVFRANRRAIEDIARRKYLAGRREKDGSILIGSEDL